VVLSGIVAFEALSPAFPPARPNPAGFPRPTSGSAGAPSPGPGFCADFDLPIGTTQRAPAGFEGQNLGSRLSATPKDTPYSPPRPSAT